MENQLGFILKVFLLSTGIPFLIKYIGPSLSIPATPTSALIIVLLPTTVMAIALGWRFQRHQTNL
ncbi:hypothetical protein G7B40_022375 [Aetokthonos hydrillicola Thurmond2011]|uniref:Uncharacterized protein n=1 Tax=Aetokthonos hydrillicola Thurmond2011 TaxID=2712845 RepID=A0AAP5M9J4_9CYAN|nr:hypothetical protein [Aetokthonos hydrillicola]MBO3460768.1 hypothetical protein [Aetokthonos hydrillicola CCALA 1050]MBW4585365.1 hypothetical protein [Aetokthonos hydrillicola CCALA 1050]MDR9897290.1 hypothetical protein [Aetokthonos hydrillicola Thurmond2011]